jgi:hypothetical protein
MTRGRNDRGQVAGVETLALGVLVFVAGLLIATNAWSVLTTRQIADSIAREYIRTYSEQPTRDAALSAARRARRPPDRAIGSTRVVSRSTSRRRSDRAFARRSRS